MQSHNLSLKDWRIKINIGSNTGMLSRTDFTDTETKMSLEYKEAIRSPTQPQS